MIGWPKGKEPGSTSIYARTNRRLPKGRQTKEKVTPINLESPVLEANSKSQSAWASEVAQ